MNGRFDQVVRDMLSLENEAVLFTSAADFILQEYALSVPDMSAKHFDFFCQVFARAASQSNKVSYQAAETVLARRALLTENNDPPELFDEVRQQTFRGDIQSLSKLAAAIGSSRSYMQPPCSGFVEQTRKFFTRQIWYHSFGEKEIQKLQHILSAEYPNPSLRKGFLGIAAEIGQISRQKRERDLNGLNRWAFAFRSDDLLKKLSFRHIYVNLAYERLIREHEIKNIDPENYYRQHRLIVQHQIKELTGQTDAKGKEICRKYALNKVYKAIAGQDKFKLESVTRALEQYAHENYYRETTAILSALDGGVKNRNVRLPQKPCRNYD